MLLAIEETVFLMIEAYGFWGLLVILTAVLVYKFFEAIIKYLVPKLILENHLPHVDFSRKKRKDAVFKMNQLLTELIEKTDADRAAVFEYHNGGYNLSNLPFLHFSLTLLKNRVGVDELSTDFKNVFVSSVPDFIQKLEKDAIYYVEDIETIKNSYPRLYRELKEDGMSKAYFTNIEGCEEQVGFIMIAFKQTPELPVHKLKKEIIKKVQKIAILLDGNKK